MIEGCGKLIIDFNVFFFNSKDWKKFQTKFFESMILYTTTLLLFLQFSIRIRISINIRISISIVISVIIVISNQNGDSSSSGSLDQHVRFSVVHS